jgi:hypothetical protein
MNRYPDRAEGAINVALVLAEHRADRQRAAAILRYTLQQLGTPDTFAAPPP